MRILQNPMLFIYVTVMGIFHLEKRLPPGMRIIAPRAVNGFSLNWSLPDPSSQIRSAI